MSFIVIQLADDFYVRNIATNSEFSSIKVIIIIIYLQYLCFIHFIGSPLLFLAITLPCGKMIWCLFGVNFDR